MLNVLTESQIANKISNKMYGATRQVYDIYNVLYLYSQYIAYPFSMWNFININWISLNNCLADRFSSEYVTFGLNIQPWLLENSKNYIFLFFGAFFIFFAYSCSHGAFQCIKSTIIVQILSLVCLLACLFARSPAHSRSLIITAT